MILSPVVVNVWFERRRIFFTLADGREVSSPLYHFPQLHKASSPALEDYTIEEGGGRVKFPRLSYWLSIHEVLVGELLGDEHRESTLKTLGAAKRQEGAQTPSGAGKGRRAQQIGELASHDLLRAARLHSKLTQAELAEKMKTTQAQVSFLERGGKVGDMSKDLQRAFKAMDLPESWRPDPAAVLPPRRKGRGPAKAVAGKKAAQAKKAGPPKKKGPGRKGQKGARKS